MSWSVAIALDMVAVWWNADGVTLHIPVYDRCQRYHARYLGRSALLVCAKVAGMAQERSLYPDKR